jgi:L-rhamnonate dehydratase
VIGSKETEEKAGGGADCHSQSHGHWIVSTPIANPSSFSQDLKTSRKAWGIDALGTVVAEVELHSGVVGVGISIGGEPACFIIENHLARFVEGQDVHNIELMWEQMFKVGECWSFSHFCHSTTFHFNKLAIIHPPLQATLNYGRKGLPIQAISAVDLALWDALGKTHNVPVYKLLGGKTKDKLPVYATSSRPDLSQKMGFQGGKFPLPYGPADGDKGMRANIERIKAVRESVGPDFPIMIDCYMALTVPYTIELARRIDREVPGGVKWIEEFLPPDDYEGYAQVRTAVSTTLLTTGEHEYTRYGYRLLLEKKAVDVLQPDITWVGGITEAKRMVALAAAYDVMVIPHGSSVFSYHLQFAFPNCPMAEFLVLSPESDKIVPLFGDL